VIDNLAASVYKRGEQARKQKTKQAVDHFLRIIKSHRPRRYGPPPNMMRPPRSQLKEWVERWKLEAFRKDYPANELQPEVTKKSHTRKQGTWHSPPLNMSASKRIQGGRVASRGVDARG
jgi:hypothetical protein